MKLFGDQVSGVRLQPKARAKTMEKRTVAIALGAMLFALSSTVDAQQPTKVYRIGYISSGVATGSTEEILRQGLRELGYIEGRNLVMEWRYSKGKVDALPGFVTELTSLKVDVIVVSGTQFALAAKRATQTIPIIFAIADDPVEAGVVASLAQPGGNLTGVTDIAGELGGKRIELLKETVPKISTLAVLVWKPDGPGNAAERNEIESAARVFGVEVQPVEVRGLDDLASSFSAMSKAGTNAFMGLTDTRFGANRQRIVDLGTKHRLPAIYPERLFAEAGGLMSYGTNRAEWRRRVVYFVDRILKGAKPTELPVERPTKFELVINLKTAKQIGVTIPQSVLFRADKVIR
jgi:putative ABC transport system substrate-binding protein